MTTEMARPEIDERLRDSGAGVLSLTDGAETYAVPEAFGYDGDRLYFQFVTNGDSRKMTFIGTTEIATLTVFTERPAESVVVRGRLVPVPVDEQKRAAMAISENADIPAVNVFPETTPEGLTMEFYQLVPDAYSGRRFNEWTSDTV
ncbi:pyridoxamine 5'-phosphate oxidase family protein [Halobellus sp. GM3]|uniref:pyridoxamine 5'-phosphate oxidase family protein n=1 Tax=Halobellus sp. GM3 TaxID=3458410 RepID=UPI00403E324F